jgi:hypothetical protein
MKGGEEGGKNSNKDPSYVTNEERARRSGLDLYKI